MAKMASAAELHRAGVELGRHADALGDAHQKLDARVDGLRWQGLGAQRFRTTASSRLRELRRLAELCELAGRRFRTAAEEVREEQARLRRAEHDVRQLLDALGSAAPLYLATTPWGCRPLPPPGDPAWAEVAQAVFAGRPRR